MKRGQILVEVVLAMAIAILAVVGLAQIATKSTSNAGSSSRRAVATTYAVAGMEWVRNQKNTIAWSDFSSTSKAPVPPNPANVYCLNSFPGSWTSMAAGACASGSTISGTEFSRSMTLSAVTAPVLQVTAVVEVTWREGGTALTSRQTSVFTSY